MGSRGCRSEYGAGVACAQYYTTCHDICLVSFICAVGACHRHFSSTWGLGFARAGVSDLPGPFPNPTRTQLIGLFSTWVSWTYAPGPTPDLFTTDLSTRPRLNVGVSEPPQNAP